MLYDYCDINCEPTIEAITVELEKYRDNFSTHSMNDHTLYLQGSKNMLDRVINYLKVIS